MAHEITKFGENEYLIQMPPSRIDYVWPEVKKLLEKDKRLLSNTCYAEDLRDTVLAGNYQLWVYVKNKKIEACCFSEIVLYSTRAKELRLHFAAGQNRDHWTKSLPIVEKWSAQYGCEQVKMEARLGWKKMLNPLGYNSRNIVLTKRINYGRRQSKTIGNADSES